VVVTFKVTRGDGNVDGSPATTNSNGVATVSSWELGDDLGDNRVTATASGLPSVTFNATATAGAPARVRSVAGNNQTAVDDDEVKTPPAVRVTDDNGNPVMGVNVNFAVVAGGGSATGVNRTTDADGEAAVGSWTLGSGSPNTLRATVAGSSISGNPVTFNAESASRVRITSAPAGPINLGQNFTVTAQLRNSDNDAVALSGVQMTITINSGGGTLNGTLSRVTDSSGAVSFTLINVTGSAGSRTFRVSGSGVGSITTAAINFN
jgi:hypothetical protein